MSLSSNVFRILSFSRSEIILIIIYSFVYGFLSLIVPVAAQGLVTVVSFGSVTQSLYTLTISVFVLLTGAAIFRILQTILVENIQQRIFAHLSLRIAKNIPKIALTVFDEYRGTELLNRFFDIFTIQKIVASLFLSGAGVFLQAVFGMLLLAFYHPFLLIFDIIFIISLVIVIIIPWRKGVKTAITESNSKYEVARWLEELSRLPELFKFDHYPLYGYEVANDKIAHYLRSRQKHFSTLFIHICGMQVIQILSGTLLLALGGILIIKDQLTLGQLVAAEIVVTALGIGVIRFAKYLEEIYDLIAASEKVNFLLELPLEQKNSVINTNNLREMKLLEPPSIELRDISFTSESQIPILSNINITIPKEGRLVIYGPRGSGKSLLANIILGLRNPTKGEVFYNNIPLKEYQLNLLRQSIIYINGIQFFDGSIMDNLLMGNDEIGPEKIHQVLHQFDLDHVISRLPKGIYTELFGNQHLLSTLELQKLMLVRSVLAEPKLIVIGELLDHMPEASLDLILNVLNSTEYKWTLIATTRRDNIAEKFAAKVCL